jgi:hypothetical protein
MSRAGRLTGSPGASPWELTILAPDAVVADPQRQSIFEGPMAWFLEVEHDAVDETWRYRWRAAVPQYACAKTRLRNHGGSKEKTENTENFQENRVAIEPKWAVR